MRTHKRILLVGGGSGGHILPNLAIAFALKSIGGSGGGQGASVDLLYVGSRSALDAKLVAEAGIPFKPIFSGKLRRYFSWQNFVDPLFVIVGFFQSLWILIRFRPHAVFTKGGFVSIPVAVAAFVLRRPIVMHESDSVMGLSNKIVARLACKICIGFPGAGLNNHKTVFTGNPVRESVRGGDRDTGYRITGFRPERPVVLIWGGSQGAQEINNMVVESFRHLKHDFQVIHVTGYGKQTAIQDSYSSANGQGSDGSDAGISDPAYRQFEYLGDELKHIYAITDVVVSRAGANSLYELAFMQKPNILVPLKSAAHDHQTKNAEYFEGKGASLVLREGELLHEVLGALWHSSQQREMMKRALSEVSRPNAAVRIAEIILSTVS